MFTCTSCSPSVSKPPKKEGVPLHTYCRTWLVVKKIWSGSEEGLVAVEERKPRSRASVVGGRGPCDRR